MTRQKVIMKTIFVSLILFAAIFAAQPGFAQGSAFSSEQARHAREHGQLLSLRKVDRILKKEIGGERKGNAYPFRSADGSYVYYPIDWTTRDGRLVYLEVDAQTGAVLKREDR